jgi:hypothetical protein
MHGILMWTIHDLPTYGLLLGHVTKGYKGCMALVHTHVVAIQNNCAKLLTSIIVSGCR